jgi:hypothetical protein
VPTLYYGGEGNIGAPRYREWRTGLAESETQSMYANSLHGNREIPGVADRVPRLVRSRKASGRNLDMHAPGKSDGGIVSMKRANKGAQPGDTGQPPAEFVERRPSG